MQISLNWINELVSIDNISLEELIEKLTLGGFEVEEVLEVKINNQTQTTLDISSTANRADSLSIQGFALEIATLLDRPIKKSIYSNVNQSWKEIINNKLEIISEIEDYSTFITVSIENINNFSSPLWLKNKLQASGILPTNDLEDFQNYILLETGYPFEFYDFDKIASYLDTPTFKLTINKSQDGEQFLASNENNYTLNKNILTVNANSVPISIAGLIEAKQFAISQKTKKILIEGSIFNGAKIRQQSRSLGLRTERSARYEKSIKNTYLIESLYRLISLLKISNPDLVCKVQTAKQVQEIPINPIQVNYKAINEILGPTIKSTSESLVYLTQIQIENYLERLNFHFIYDKLEHSWLVRVPHTRTEDISREIDVIEEIGRIHGFNNFLTTLPEIKTVGKEDYTYQVRKKITSSLLNLGFNELINFSLVGKNTFVQNDINIVNPLLTDCSYLRVSLLPNLIKTVQENIKQKNVILEGFEYGHVFSFDSNLKLEEKEYVGGIFGGLTTKRNWNEDEKPLTWFEAKGKIEQLLTQLNLTTIWKKSNNKEVITLLHPYRSADLYFSKNVCLGTFGQISPILAKKLNIAPDTYLFEFDLEALKLSFAQNRLVMYKSYSSYPKITKDLSFIIKQTIEFDEIKASLYCNGTNLLSKIDLLSEYRGESIPDESTSLCLKLLFQSETETLETKKIETILKKLELILIEKFDATIRN